MAVTSNIETVTPVVGSEIVVATIACDPVDEVCAYMVGVCCGFAARPGGRITNQVAV